MEHAHAVTGQLDLLAFLMLGLIGSAGHCSVMCTPFVMLVSERYADPVSGGPSVISQLWYTAGRMTTYALLGAAAGSVGALFQFAGDWAGVGRAAALFAGLALILSAGMSLAGVGRSARSGITRFTRALYRRLPAHPFRLGLILGLLPCGLLYTALVAAVARGTATDGALALTMFAAGTSPFLIGIAVVQQRLLRHAAFVMPVANVFVLAMGCWYVWMGLAQ